MADQHAEHACTCIMSTITGLYGSCEGCKRNRERDPSTCPGEVVQVEGQTGDIPSGIMWPLVVHVFACTRCEWRFVLTLDTPEQFRRDLIPSAHLMVPSNCLSGRTSSEVSPSTLTGRTHQWLAN